MALQGYPVRSHEGGLKLITATITLGAASVASTTFVTDGIAASAVRTSAGLYTIVLSNSCSGLEYAHMSPIIATAADITTHIVSYTPSTKTLVARAVAAAVATDPAAGVVLQFLLAVKEM